MTAVAIHAASNSDLVQQVAADLATDCPQLDRGCYIETVYDWLLSSVAFKGDTTGVEHVRHPDQLIAEIDAKGVTGADCDCLATLGAAVALAMGLHPVFVTDGLTLLDEYQHVYLAIEYHGRLIPLDPQHRTPCGQWPTAARRKLWTVEEPG